MEHVKKINVVKIQKRRKRAAICIALVLVGFYCISMYRMTGGLCVLKGFFGFPCPGCGGTRAMILLAKGDVSGSLELNPSAPLLFLCLLNEIRVNYFMTGNKKRAAIILAAGIFVSVIIYIVRMNMYFPFKEPYVFNSQCLFLKFLRAIHF